MHTSFTPHEHHYMLTVQLHARINFDVEKIKLVIFDHIDIITLEQILCALPKNLFIFQFWNGSKIALADIMHCSEKNESGPFTGQDDLYTCWLISIANGSELLEVGRSMIRVACLISSRMLSTPIKSARQHTTQTKTCNTTAINATASFIICSCLQSQLKDSMQMKKVVIQAGNKTKLSLDANVIKLLCIPLSREKHHGMVGNGM